MAELIANEFAAKAREEKEGQQQRTTTNKRKQPNDNADDNNMKTKKKQLEKEKLQEILATLLCIWIACIIPERNFEINGT